MEEEIQPPDIPEPTVIPDEDPGPVVQGWATAPVSGDRIDVNERSFVAGDPAGARIEIRSTGFHAFNGAGTETAHIDGAEGVFVGGEFRTSDQLPGQVTLSDTGYVSPGTFDEGPGIRVTPESMAGLAIPPSLGPSANGMVVSGGETTTGTTAFTIYTPHSVENRIVRANGAQATAGVTGGLASLSAHDENGNEGVIEARPTDSVVRTRNADGSGAMVYADGESAELSTADAAWVAKSRIKVDGREAYLWTTGADQVNRILSVDSGGVWVKTNKSGAWKHYNLEETAQDSGWQSITPDAGYTGSASFAWRNKGGVIWYRGTVTATWAEGWNTIATLPAEVRPEYGYTVNEAGTSAGVLIRVQVDGRLQLYAPTAGSSTHRFTSLSYPIG